MDLTILGIAGFAVMLALLLMRVHVGVSMGLVGLIGAYMVMGPNSFSLAKITPYGTLGGFEHAVLPLFILMGMFAAHSGIAVSLFDAAQKWLGWMKGGLLLATTLSIGIFGACCGSSVASATTFTKIALPELIKNKYDPGLSGGAIAAGGTQAALIPPSALLVFYGILTEQSIGKLLLAGIIPGIISILIYMAAVMITLSFFPDKGPGRMYFSFPQRMRSLKGVWPIPLLFMAILGGMFFGIFTPSEAGGFGALMTMCLAIATIGIKNARLKEAMISAVSSSAMIFFIMICALIFVRFIALTQISNVVGTWIEGLKVSNILVLIIILFGYMVLGCFLDAIGMIALTIPVVYPVIELLGIDGIWFGILLVKVVEVGLVTPPIGINVFVVKGAAGDAVSTGQLFVGITPFIAADIATLAILVAFPQLTLLIPNLM